MNHDNQVTVDRGTQFMIIGDALRKHFIEQSKPQPIKCYTCHFRNCQRPGAATCDCTCHKTEKL